MTLLFRSFICLFALNDYSDFRVYVNTVNEKRRALLTDGILTFTIYLGLYFIIYLVNFIVGGACCWFALFA